MASDNGQDGEIVEEYFIEDTWMCTSCRANNIGRDMTCKNCGSPKDKSEHYDAGNPDGSRVTDPDLLRKARAGANRNCPFCKSDNRAIDGKCPECGASIEEQAPSSPKSKFVEATNSPPQRAPRRPSAVAVPKDDGGKVRVWRVLLAFAASVGAAFFAVWLFTPRVEKATVTSTHWKVQKTLHQRTIVHNENWGAPPEAFNSVCESRLRGYVDCHPRDCNPHQKQYRCSPYQCNAHQETYNCDAYQCNCQISTSTTSQKNGFSKVTKRRSCDTCYKTCSRTKYETCYKTCSKTVYETCYDRCPEYNDWCRYDAYKWPVTATKLTQGTGETITAPDLEPQGHEQYIDVAEEFEVTFNDGKKSHVYRAATRSDYLRFHDQELWEIKIGVAGGVDPVKALVN